MMKKINQQGLFLLRLIYIVMWMTRYDLMMSSLASKARIQQVDGNARLNEMKTSN